MHLRKQLQIMTEVPDPSQHPKRLEAIRHECPHTIRVLDWPLPIARYTCLVFALGFAGSPDYEAIASRGFNVVFAGREFVRWLLDRDALFEVPEAEAKNGDLVLYFDHDGYMHAGLVRGDGRIASKWGVGHLYEHDLWDLPESYGATVRFFQQLTGDQAIDYFIQFARHKGMFL